MEVITRASVAYVIEKRGRNKRIYHYRKLGEIKVTLVIDFSYLLLTFVFNIVILLKCLQISNFL